jgi:tetratricopeptide (TPR) repeat protein
MMATQPVARAGWGPHSLGAGRCVTQSLLLSGCVTVDLPEEPDGTVEFDRCPAMRRSAGEGEPVGRGFSASPDTYRAQLRAPLAQAYLERGAPGVAAIEARAALDLDPANRGATHLLALLAVQDGEFALAEQYFRRALAAPGADEDVVLSGNYARFICERLGRQRVGSDCKSAQRRSDESKSDVSGLRLLHTQSIAMDNSAASGANRQFVDQGRTGEPSRAAGGQGRHSNIQENSSEESRDE